jgi:hypothetical protein
MHKKLVASITDDVSNMEVLISFDCTESRENKAHPDNPVPEWQYSFDTTIRQVEFVFCGESVRLIKYPDLKPKQQKFVDSVVDEQVEELWNKETI